MEQPNTEGKLIGSTKILCWSGSSWVKNLPANAEDTRDMASIPELGRSPGVGNGNPLQYSCLWNSMDRGAWQAAVHGVTKSDTTEHHHPSSSDKQ